MKSIYLAGGCFWGTEAFFKQLPGVIETEVGYANSQVDNPTYQLVCTGTTNAAECVRVSYDPEKIGLKLLVEAYLSIVDPTSVNRQGADEGTQYRTGIWWTDSADEAVVCDCLDTLEARLGQPLAIQTGALGNFWDAESYHQDYLDKNPNGYCHVDLGAAARFVETHRDEFGKAKRS